MYIKKFGDREVTTKRRGFVMGLCRDRDSYLKKKELRNLKFGTVGMSWNFLFGSNGLQYDSYWLGMGILL